MEHLIRLMHPFSDSFVQNSFEFPRQQDGDQTKEPEMMGFKTCQRMLDSNQSTSPNNNSQFPAVSSPAQMAVSSNNNIGHSIQKISSPNPLLSPMKDDTSCKDCPTPVSSVSTIHPHHSVSNYDPSVARLNLPKNVIENLEKLVNRKPKPVVSNADPDAPTQGMKIRFYSTLFVLTTIGILELIANSYGNSQFSGFVIAFVTLFSFHWLWINGSGLSRQKKAYFNEQNVLETYKYVVYDREFGHLFAKEPDTPGNCCGPPPKPSDSNFPSNPVQNVANDLLAQFKMPPKEKIEFGGGTNVQDHYGNMYDNIRRINQEMDLMAKAKQANSDSEKPDGSTSKFNGTSSFNDQLIPHAQSTPLVPAEIPLPGQINNKKNCNEIKKK
uniref:Uncharacterized protein n=1 Tax=Panagrolaimus sp. PS1159 TaxID=55785 RepID=A0AC35EZE0_9BILA